ncbi:septum formation family protein [Herbiconiux sp. CPCC 205763]|uniref:Septum formation family protein n=1 Tax=Herbiconiux aconitum TaxID=2970913 RepID=A0ABT2GS33_9MICO|nr:septum formation family protein [Herbiconiux aconitum]MCS5719037.1 septum formation family protein [Herbiconiux aconitum]
MLIKRLALTASIGLALVLTGCAGDQVPSGAPVDPTTVTVAPTPTPTTHASTAPSADPKQTDVFTLKVGDCLNDIDEMLISDVPLVDCAAPHDLEIFDEFTVTDASWDPVSLAQEADSGCTDRFAAFIGLPYDDSTLDVTSYKPTATSWITGDRLISCMVGDSSAPTVGTLRGAAR